MPNHMEELTKEVNKKTLDARSQIEQLIKESIVEASMREMELLGKIEKILSSSPVQETEEKMPENAVESVMPVSKGYEVIHRGRLSCGNLILDENRKVAHCNEQSLQLTRTEYMLLRYLILHSDQTVSRDELLKEVWGYRQVIETRATDDMIKRVRKKLKAQHANVYIQTLRGVGFYIEVEN